MPVLWGKNVAVCDDYTLRPCKADFDSSVSLDHQGRPGSAHDNDLGQLLACSDDGEEAVMASRAEELQQER